MYSNIILCDMDGVVANFNKGILDVNPHVDLLDEDTNKTGRDLVDEIVSSDVLFFQKLQPIEGSVEAVKHLMKHFHVYFCSTPMESVPHSFTGKKEWLNEHFGDKAYKNLILTHRKDLCLGRYLIDDRIKNGVDKFTGEHIHYGTEEFPNWDTVLKHILG